MTKKNQSILIIYTGGTIGMVEDPDNNSLKPLDFKHISIEVPELKKFKHDLHCRNLDPIIDSSDIKPENWIKIAELIFKSYHDFDGFVILHGTDTMAYSASALSFLLENLQKPIIFTGSQLPIGLIRTDARENLISAIEIASTQTDKGPMAPGVSIYFENKLFQGNRTTKLSAENFNAFISPNFPVLAESGVHLKFNQEAIQYPEVKKDLILHTSLNQDIAIIKLFPGISDSFIKNVLNISGLKAVILETFGSGNGPTESWFIQSLEEFISKGGIILNVTQCLAGRVEQGRYETSLKLRNAGVIGGSDITTEAAVTKLMFLLGQNLEKEKLIFLLKRPISGEIS
ncbi:MAG: asparaginase [Bacteroidales bacterium]|nr:asparaginase [Bacteroidales bacterium]